MNEGAIADDLVGLGLTQYEAKAYVALVRRDSSTAAQVSRLAGVPRQRIYDVLSSLAEKGLAASRPGDDQARQRCRHRARTPAEASLIYPARTTAPLR
jgi:hypothetical protein